MTKLMEQLVSAASRLPPEEQDVLATCWISDVRVESISTELRAELERRMREHQQRPDDVLSWDQVQRRIDQRLAR